MTNKSPPAWHGRHAKTKKKKKKKRGCLLHYSGLWELGNSTWAMPHHNLIVIENMQGRRGLVSVARFNAFRPQSVCRTGRAWRAGRRSQDKAI